ncbi:MULTISPECIES: formyltransferase family protein [unclassified Vibrio]|uniref:formyltransferase family protein n=1 Tax=unclassified Vibrio TaxID=2614977 RepID=UPI00148293F7|nr:MULTISPECIES: formyltransferase family protein [unclassified Vibrio]NNN45441.1 hypothetical protein [Vibrio sp. 1-1(7)]NNN73275.1 hypothetical protein [Vibrio sp. 12-2(3-a)]
MNELIFAGSGKGGIVALKSLQAEFEKIYVLSDDEIINSILRSSDRKIKDFMDVDTKIVVCAGYMKIIKSKDLESKTFINTHPSLLPKYRGIHSLAWAMLNFEKKLGFTIHLMNENIDDGPILEQFEIEYNDETSKEISLKFENYVETRLGRVVKDFCEGKILPKEQDRMAATWVARRNLRDCLIKYEYTIEYIERMFKVLVRPYPLPMIELRGNVYEITSASFIKTDYYTDIGRVLNIENRDVYIKVSNGILVVKELRVLDENITAYPGDILKLGERL